MLKKHVKGFKKKHGEDYFVKLGALGGAKTTGQKGFAIMDKDRHKEVSAKGGKKGKRD